MRYYLVTKMRHHSVLTAISLMVAFYILAAVLGVIISPWWWFLYVPGLAFSILCFLWNNNITLICPDCNRSVWDKTNYYCGRCGTLLVFRRREKVKKGDKPKPQVIIIPTCSRGHEVYSFDKYCSRCGERLKS